MDHGAWRGLTFESSLRHEEGHLPNTTDCTLSACAWSMIDSQRGLEGNLADEFGMQCKEDDGGSWLT